MHESVKEKNTAMEKLIKDFKDQKLEMARNYRDKV
jgi:hypothetical protein